jgi:hypothetical protein
MAEILILGLIGFLVPIVAAIGSGAAILSIVIKIAGYAIGIGLLLCAALFVAFVLFEWLNQYYPGIASSFEKSVHRAIDCLFEHVIPAFLGLAMLYGLNWLINGA